MECRLVERGVVTYRVHAAIELYSEEACVSLEDGLLETHVLSEIGLVKTDLSFETTGSEIAVTLQHECIGEVHLLGNRSVTTEDSVLERTVVGNDSPDLTVAEIKRFLKPGVRSGDAAFDCGVSEVNWMLVGTLNVDIL
ncbi:hypothetical protein [Haladaptatus cibarius]|uniref:hypothetical protein n=1 Tax=Haladaptatus cibarius TaxID=453847 RepID=UPI001B80D365|nr:hypothetical protein [Haladaptatus cibarius]